MFVFEVHSSTMLGMHGVTAPGGTVGNERLVVTGSRPD